MDFALSDEQNMIYDYGKSLVKTYDRKYWMDCADAGQFPVDMYKQVAADGFVGTMVPEAYGGSGLGLLEMELFLEGLSDQGIPLLSLVIGATMSMAPIGDHGTEEQKQKYLPDACAGKTRFCFAITEPGAGTNTIEATTMAKQGPDGRFKLNGAKTFITDFVESDYALVVARTTPHTEVKRKTDGFTLFIVDTKAKGVEAHPIPVSIPIPELQYSVFFDDVELGPENVLGEVGKGFSILFESLNPERVLVGAICAGMGRYAMDRAVEYANDRVVFNGPIGAYQALQHPLAKAKTEIELASLMTRKAAWLFDRGEACGGESNMAKYAAAEAALHAVDASLQCFGGNGFTKEYGIFDIYPMVRLFKTAPLNSEMILNYIGEHVLGLPRSY
ncbi:MAG: acyl-CoA/acyl-ACP dehydrogenase [Gammaproteobacteria bacterium]|nr:acyl-CoA/acyl-ACP dehydrogenase [Gammaproteobacteria bacterium]MBQ0838940.1 acyl-CoA/acyl-ACP dehydrogenase [Gammaproteobacteria bacterium]